MGVGRRRASRPVTTEGVFPGGVWGVLHADDAGIVPQSLGKHWKNDGADCGGVHGALGLTTAAEAKTEVVSLHGKDATTAEFRVDAADLLIEYK